MHLHRRFHHRKVYMMIPHHLVGAHLVDISHHSLPSPFHIDVNISRRSHVRVGIEQRIPLPLQDTAAESSLLKVLAHLGRIHKQPHILLPYLLRHSHPLHQQVRPRSHLLRQLLDTMKQHANQRLFLGNGILHLPVSPLQRLRNLRTSPDAKPQELKKYLLLRIHSYKNIRLIPSIRVRTKNFCVFRAFRVRPNRRVFLR